MALKRKKRPILLFLEDDVNIYDILIPSQLELLTRLAFSAEFNTGRIKLTFGERRRISKDLKISDTLLSKRVMELAQAGVITKDRNELHLNPKFVWFGGVQVRESLIKQSNK